MALWIHFTLLAAFAQAWRNALQNQLSKEVAALGVTLARVLWSWPLALIYLTALHQFAPQPLPRFPAGFWLFAIGAACFQIAATALMVLLFQRRSFAAGIGLAKSEALLAAVVGVLFFGTALSPLGWAGVVIGAVAVWCMTTTRGTRLDGRTVGLGLGSGLCFALTSLWIREASLRLELPAIHAAAWSLLTVLLTQCASVSLWLALRDPGTLRALWQRPGLTARVSLCSFIASIGWFTAMSLQQVPIVKTLGQVEVLFTLLISWRWLREPISSRDRFGLLLIAVAAVCVLWN